MNPINPHKQARLLAARDRQQVRRRRDSMLGRSTAAVGWPPASDDAATLQ